MRKRIFRIVAIIAVATVATVIVAQELEEASIVKAMAVTGRQGLQEAIDKADADYFRRLDPSANRATLARCRSIIATCKKTIASLERIAASAKKAGSDVEAALAQNKIATVQEYLDKAEADMSESMIAVKPVRPVRVINIRGGRMRFGSHYYMVLIKLGVTWDQARRMAESHGGYLATADSAAELMFMKKFLPPKAQAWVGGTSGSDPVQWQWASGKKIVDTLWKQGTPEVKPNHRVTINDGGLLIHPADQATQGFVIEWDR